VILVRAVCGACAVESRSPAAIVGRVVRHNNGVVLWESKSKRRAVGISQEMVGLRQAAVLSHPRVPGHQPPSRLRAVCDRHGEGSVSTADVIDKRGRIIVDFNVASA
jgi:hypothetical protein